MNDLLQILIVNVEQYKFHCFDPIPLWMHSLHALLLLWFISKQD